MKNSLPPSIARLEAKNAEMAAALRSFVMAMEAEERLADELGEPKGYMVSLAFSRERANKMCAALSGEGKGGPQFICNCDCHYVSEACCPECTKRRGKVWEQVEKALNDFDRWQDEHMAADPGKIPACLGRGCPSCGQARARLRAAMKGE